MFAAGHQSSATVGRLSSSQEVQVRGARAVRLGAAACTVLAVAGPRAAVAAWRRNAHGTPAADAVFNVKWQLAINSPLVPDPTGPAYTAAAAAADAAGTAPGSAGPAAAADAGTVLLQSDSGAHLGRAAHLEHAAGAAAWPAAAAAAGIVIGSRGKRT